jgi:glycosyltransferase involved in cell wall biosynthesis
MAARRRRICMATYSNYLADARVSRYAEALAGRGDHVDVISLQRGQEKPDQETSGKVNIIRLQPRFGKTEESPLSYLWPTLRFLVSSSIWIARSHRREPYDVFHIHNIPDFLVFAATYPRLKGAKVILDIHDIVPELYASKFNVKNGAPVISLLKWTERLSARNTDHIIMSNHLWLDKYTARTGTAGRCSVFINNVDRSIFYPRPKTRQDGKFIIIFPGGLQWHQGLDIALRAFQKVSGTMPQTEFHIYGDGNMKHNLMELSRELGLENKVHFFNPVSVREIAGVMANADLGVVPKRADSFGNEAYSTKIMEFMSLGIPVIVSGTKIDHYYFDDSVVRFFESGNADSLAEAMRAIIGDQKLRQEMVARASAYAANSSWESRKGDYLSLVDSLCLPDGDNGAPGIGKSE